MISAIIVTSISLAALLMLASLRAPSRALILAAIINGIFISGTAHRIPEDISEMNAVDPIVNAVFGILYLPILVFLNLHYGKRRLSRALGLMMTVFILATFGVLYYGMLMRQQMPVIAYANLLWHIEVVLMVVMLQTHLQITSHKANRSLIRTELGIIRCWLLIPLCPYITFIFSWMLPQDNFLIPYVPVVSVQTLTDIVSCILILFAMWLTIRCRSLAQSHQREHNKAKGDLAF